MTINSIQLINHQTTDEKIKALAFGGIKTGLSLFTTTKLLDISIINPSETTRKALEYTNKLGKYGLIFSGISALVLAGTMLYDWA